MQKIYPPANIEGDIKFHANECYNLIMCSFSSKLLEVIFFVVVDDL